MTAPAIIIAAPNGARRTPADHPALPVTAEALAREAAACLAAGASVLHMHVRDADGRHTLDPACYREAMAAVAEAAPGMIVQATSEAAGRYSRQEQMAAMRALQPEAMSVAMREMVPNEDAEIEAGKFYDWAAGAGVHVQHILYSPEEVARFHELIRRGVILAERPSLIFVLGAYNPPREGRPEEVAAFLDAAAGLDADFTVCAFGGQEHACVAEALRLGGHARVGFENNLRMPDGSLAKRSAELVELAAAEARQLGRGPATVAEARAALGLTRKQPA